ncbi:hypothetical protein ACIGO8_33255 [Streptomyces sp. NPDC053493]|uniref:hypothetical protein n=1 Tax=Streptomyces sp. NPDC053493 TaxID=3365705 RepID=UPI0037CFAEDE
MDVLGSPSTGNGLTPDAVKVVRSLTRLVKLDFWLRCPDYLAHELLTEVTQDRQPAEATLRLVADMLGGKAPSLHRYPMAKYLYGAYERPDNALALLASRRHISVRRVNESSQNARRDYYLLAKGQDAATALQEGIPEMAWYVKQAQAIGLIPEAVSGGQMRKRQYEHEIYKSVAPGKLIPEITEEVTQRAQEVAARFGVVWPPAEGHEGGGRG